MNAINSDNPISDGDRLLSIHEVLSITGRGRTSLYRDQNFPKPLKVGQRSVRWASSEIAAWIDRARARRDAANGGGGAA